MFDNLFMNPCENHSTLNNRKFLAKLEKKCSIRLKLIGQSIYHHQEFIESNLVFEKTVRRDRNI